jgi:hypothetical protein
MPDAWSRRVARLKSRYERGDEIELERLIGEAVAVEREACAKIAEKARGKARVASSIAEAIRNQTG